MKYRMLFRAWTIKHDYRCRKLKFKLQSREGVKKVNFFDMLKSIGHPLFDKMTGNVTLMGLLREPQQKHTRSISESAFFANCVIASSDMALNPSVSCFCWTCSERFIHCLWTYNRPRLGFGLLVFSEVADLAPGSSLTVAGPWRPWSMV